MSLGLDMLVEKVSSELLVNSNEDFKPSAVQSNCTFTTTISKAMTFKTD